MLKVLREKNKDLSKPAPKVRSPKWQFDEVDVDRSLHNNIFYKTYFASLSLLFPEGERFFIRSLKPHLDKITDPQLRKDVKGFIAQETQHGVLHERLNNKVVTGQYEIQGFLDRWTHFAFNIVEKFADRWLPKALPLSFTAAAEHFTATWAMHALNSPLFQNIVDEEMRDLINWHAIEEIEHKHVAFDVLRSVDDSFFTRAAGMLVAGPLIAFLSFWGALYLLRQEKDLDLKQLMGTLLYEVTNDEGLLNLYVKAFFEYFKPGFHPSDDQSEYEAVVEMAAALEERLAKIS